MDHLRLSGSDDDTLLLDTPAVRKTKIKTENEDNNATAGKLRNQESHYSVEEAREAALKKELENVRNVNRVIEGVVESLEKARTNMNVRATPSPSLTGNSS